MASLLGSFLSLKPKIEIDGRKYTIVSQIGEGAFAYVYKVKGSKEENFAVKKMICQTEEQLGEAKKEIEILQRIDHTNVLKLLASDMKRNEKKGYDEVFLLLPLFVGSVQNVIDKAAANNGFPLCSFVDGFDVVKILRNCAEGLAAIHSSGYRHNDFKPANILLTDSLQAVITDFGSASSREFNVTNRAEALQIQELAAQQTTAPFRAPELFNTPSVCVIDGKSDIWSFGCTIYTMYFSRNPFENAVEGFSALRVLAGHYICPEGHPWPSDYIDLISGCLNIETSSRLSIEELQVALKRLPSPPLDLSFRAIEKKEEFSNPTRLIPKSAVTTSSYSSTSPKTNLTHKSNDSSRPPPPPSSPPASISAEFVADFSSHFGLTDSTEEKKVNDSTNDTFKSQLEDDEDEFGDFEGAGSRASFGHSSLSKFTTAVSITNSPESLPKESSSSSSLNVVNKIITDSKDPAQIKKEGCVYILRGRGMMKQLIRKSVWMVLTRDGLLIRKSSSTESKIHNILSFQRSLAFTPSDTTSIGMNGLIIQGFTPSAFLTHFGGELELELEENGQESFEADSSFVTIRLEIAFDSKDIMSEWMDSIDLSRELNG